MERYRFKFGLEGEEREGEKREKKDDEDPDFFTAYSREVASKFKDPPPLDGLGRLEQDIDDLQEKYDSIAPEGIGTEEEDAFTRKIMKDFSSFERAFSDSETNGSTTDGSATSTTIDTTEDSASVSPLATDIKRDGSESSHASGFGDLSFSSSKEDTSIEDGKKEDELSNGSSEFASLGIDTGKSSGFGDFSSGGPESSTKKDEKETSDGSGSGPASDSATASGFGDLSIGKPIEEGKKENELSNGFGEFASLGIDKGTSSGFGDLSFGGPENSIKQGEEKISDMSEESGPAPRNKKEDELSNGFGQFAALGTDTGTSSGFGDLSFGDPSMDSIKKDEKNASDGSEESGSAPGNKKEDELSSGFGQFAALGTDTGTSSGFGDFSFGGPENGVKKGEEKTSAGSEESGSAPGNTKEDELSSGFGQFAALGTDTGTSSGFGDFSFGDPEDRVNEDEESKKEGGSSSGFGGFAALGTDAGTSQFGNFVLEEGKKEGGFSGFSSFDDDSGKESEHAKKYDQGFFIESKKFEGERKGFAFYKGPQGLGYYKDEWQSQVPVLAPKSNEAGRIENKDLQPPILFSEGTSSKETLSQAKADDELAGIKTTGSGLGSVGGTKKSPDVAVSDPERKGEVSDFLAKIKLDMYIKPIMAREIKTLAKLKRNVDTVIMEAKMKKGHAQKLKTYLAKEVSSFDDYDDFTSKSGATGSWGGESGFGQIPLPKFGSTASLQMLGRTEQTHGDSQAFTQTNDRVFGQSSKDSKDAMSFGAFSSSSTHESVDGDSKRDSWSLESKTKNTQAFSWGDENGDTNNPNSGFGLNWGGNETGLGSGFSDFESGFNSLGNGGSGFGDMKVGETTAWDPICESSGFGTMHEGPPGRISLTQEESKPNDSFENYRGGDDDDDYD